MAAAAEAAAITTVVRAADGQVLEVPALEDVIHATPGAIILADTQGKIMFVNQYFATTLGYSRRNAVGQSLALFVPGETLKSLQDMLRRLVVTGSVNDGTGEFRDGMGNQIDVVSNTGEVVPMLVNVARTYVGGRYWVVLDMQDLRNHISKTQGEELVRWGHVKRCVVHAAAL